MSALDEKMTMPAVRVKICGITSLEAAVHAAAAGADALGLVFYENSPRHMQDWDLAAEIARTVGPFVAVTGLFVNASSSLVEQVLARVPLSLLQFHGDESESYCRHFERPYLKALRMKPGVDIRAVMDNYLSANGLLLDAYKAGVPGGTGETFAWSRVPKHERPIVLAGGLNPDNVASAVAQVQPWAVDVSGGVERAPGVKDDEKVRQFILRAKSRDNKEGQIDREHD